MNFVAIDFETANEKRNSPCSLGLTIVQDGKIIDEKYWLIRPKEMRFTHMNIMIHGIRPSDVEDALEFDALWPEILPYLKDNLVVAHNASFDFSVLRSTLSLYDIPFPTLSYCCTMVMSRHFFCYLPNAKLNTVANHLGFKFNHHHASADATACAYVFLEIAKEVGTNDLDILSDTVGFKIGQLYEGGYTSAGSLGIGKVSKRRETLTEAKPTTYSDTTYFKDKLVAFTGPLQTMARHEAIAIIEKLGGDYTPSVTLKTNLVITNVPNPHLLNEDQMSTKLRRATTLIARGQKIDFLTEAEFLKLITPS